jgi:predicted RNase H-like HicB family nuclease
VQRYIAFAHVESDGLYRIVFPDFPDLSCSGPSLDRLLDMAGPLVASYIDEFLEDGRDIPAPTPIEALRRGSPSAESDLTRLIALDVPTKDPAPPTLARREQRLPETA